MGKLRTAARVFILGLAASAFLAFALPSNARATTISSTATSTFNQSNIAPASPVQNWGSLNISCNGVTCSVSLTPNGVTFFGNEFLEFNLAATAGTPVASIGTLSGGGNVNGFGTFQYQISLADGPGSGVSSGPTAVFTVAFTGSASALLVNNTSGWDAVGHIALPSGCTGFAGESVGGTSTEAGDASACVSVTNFTPEPSSSALLFVGAALLAGTYLLRRRETDDMAI